MSSLAHAVLTKRLLDETPQGCFLFAVVWSIGGVTDAEGRQKFDQQLRKLLAHDPLPEAATHVAPGTPHKITVPFPEGRMVGAGSWLLASSCLSYPSRLWAAVSVLYTVPGPSNLWKQPCMLVMVPKAVIPACDDTQRVVSLAVLAGVRLHVRQEPAQVGAVAGQL